MCKNALDGGQRCASHTRTALTTALATEETALKALRTAEERWARHGGDQDDWRVMNALTTETATASQARYQRHTEFASTPTGRKEIEAQRAEAAANPGGPGRFSASYYDLVLRDGDRLRETNQAVKAAIKAAAAKKAAAEPKPTRPDGVMVTGAEIAAGGTFIDPDSGDIVEVHRSHYTPTSKWHEFYTTDGWTVVVKDGVKVKKVPDGTATTGQTFGDYKAEMNTDQHPNAMHEDDFYGEYEPHGDGETLDDPPADADPKHVWTIIEGEHDYQYAVPGHHTVNAIGYITTDKPWTTGDEEAIWVDGSQFDN